MAHSKLFMLDEIKRMVAEMQSAFKHIKTPEEHLVLPEETINLSADLIREGYKWLVIVFDNKHSRWLKVRSLLDESQWDRYFLWGGFENHREMVMLKEASLHLRREVVARTRPDLFKRSKLNVLFKKQAKAKNQHAKDRDKAKSQRAKAGKPKKQSKASQRTKAAKPSPVAAGEANLPDGEE